MKTSRLIGAVMTPLGKGFVHVGRYPGGAVAVELRSCTEESMGELTTDLVPIGARIAIDEFWVKTWGDNVRIVHPMLDSELFEDTGKMVSTGYAFAPIWRIRHPEHVPPTARRRSPAACSGAGRARRARKRPWVAQALLCLRRRDPR